MADKVTRIELGDKARHFPRFAEGDVIATPWGDESGQPIRVERVYQTTQGGRTVTAYDTIRLEPGKREPTGGFTEEAGGIERVVILSRAATPAGAAAHPEG